jgi:hypothetical protein
VVVGEKGDKISQPLTFGVGPVWRGKCVSEIGVVFYPDDIIGIIRRLFSVWV